MLLSSKKSALLFIILITTTTSLAADSKIWTDWYRHGLLFGGIQLIKMRNWLDKHSLHDTNVELPKTFQCDPNRKYVRSADGSCNDENDPAMGAAGIRFGRNIPLTAIKVPTEAEILDPNPREISRELLTRKEFKPVSFLNMFAASWIQFMVHDWVSHGENEPADPIKLTLAPDDPFGSEMIILRTQIDRTRTDADHSIPMSFINENTHWWDGSQIYGSDQATQNKIRSFRGSFRDGKISMAPNGRLPIDTDGVEVAGFKRNWWLGIDLMHQLFVLEHNAIADYLKTLHPDWDDQKLFDHARLINVAVMAKIHTKEWTPAILSNPILKRGMDANWSGFNEDNGKLIDLFKFIKDPVFNGIVGGKKDLHGVPYSMTEEFTSVYRLHSLLPEQIDIRSNSDNRNLMMIPTEFTRDAQAHGYLDKTDGANHQLDMIDFIYSFGTQHPGALTLNNYPKFLQNLSVPIVGKMDLGTTDLVRDRERGVPRYNEFRRLLHLKPIKQFEDLTDDPDVLEKLHRLYGSVEKLDLLIGTLAESHRPDGFGFGETQFQIFLLMASRRLQADRFFTTDFRSGVYTPEGIAWIKKATFKSVLLRHYPGLQKHLEGIDNAFRPWNL